MRRRERARQTFRTSISPTRQRNKGSLVTAKVVPVFLTACVIYCSYVILGPLSINYLINAPSPRVNTGLAVSIVWFVLLIPLTVAWVRLLATVALRPGYVPSGDGNWNYQDYPPPPEGLEPFYSKDVFVCDSRGLPKWCQVCHNWKPDRAHHNQDVGRCTMKMDHFCPWVGGVVGEQSYKFFVQFLGYAFLQSTYAMILLAYFVSEDRSNAQWIVAMALAAFFSLFTLGMIFNCLWMVFRNVTTIENIDMKPNGMTMFLAVLLPPEMQGHGQISPPPTAKTSSSRSETGGNIESPLTSDLDDPSHANYFASDQRRRRSKPNVHWRGTITYPLSLPSDRPPLPAPIPRTFAILETTSGLNPWDLGSPYRNYIAIFGPQLHDWVLPLRHSPCCDHSSAVSTYPLGPQFEQLLHDSGLEDSSAAIPSHGDNNSPRHKRHKQKLDQGWQNGERPDGWETEKSVRRAARREERRRARDETGDRAVP